MREEFPGYYRHSDEERAELWKTAVVVPDTNVLLRLYALGGATRAKVLTILTKLGERLFVPHQVAYEFQENRVGVIETQKRVYSDLDGDLSTFRTEAMHKLRQHPRLDEGELREKIENAITQIADDIAKVREQHPDPLDDGDPLGTDSVRDALAEAISGRIGMPRDAGELKRDGASRYEQKTPPGWKDKEKPESKRYGDLAIWLDAIDAAGAAEKPLIVVTEDRKEDWWWEEGKRRIGPQPALAAEVKAKIGQAFHLASFDEFIEDGGRAFGLELSPEERDDVARAAEVEQTPVPSDWVVVNPAGHQSYDPTRWHWAFPLEGLDPAYQKLTSPPGWMSTAEVDGSGATLELRINSNYLRHMILVQPIRFTCLVYGPDGGRAETTRVLQALETTLNYPDDFTTGITESGPGRYTYSWHVMQNPGAWGVPTGNVAVGHFDLEDNAAEANGEDESST